MYFTTLITEGVSYRYGNYWRASAAAISGEPGREQAGHSSCTLGPQSGASMHLRQVALIG